MKRIRILVVALLLPHFAACGGAATRSNPSIDDVAKKAEAAQKKAKDDQTGSTSKSADKPATGDAGSSATSKKPSASGVADATPAPKKDSENTMVIDLSVDPSCVRRYESVTMTVKTEKFADLSYGLSYADGENHGQYGLGRADAKGVYVKRFVVPAKAAPGEVTVLVAGMNADTQHGGSAQETFEVASTSC